MQSCPNLFIIFAGSGKKQQPTFRLCYVSKGQSSSPDNKQQWQWALAVTHISHDSLQFFSVPNKKHHADAGLFWKSQSARPSLKVDVHMKSHLTSLNHKAYSNAFSIQHVAAISVWDRTRGGCSSIQSVYSRCNLVLKNHAFSFAD